MNNNNKILQNSKSKLNEKQYRQMESAWIDSHTSKSGVILEDSREFNAFSVVCGKICSCFYFPSRVILIVDLRQLCSTINHWIVDNKQFKRFYRNRIRASSSWLWMQYNGEIEHTHNTAIKMSNEMGNIDALPDNAFRIDSFIPQKIVLHFNG